MTATGGADPVATPPGVLRTVGLVARNDLRHRIRNRSALITAFVGPLVFAVVFSVLIGGASNPTFTIGVVDADGSTMSASMASSLTGPDSQAAQSPVTFRSVADRAAGEADVDDGELDAAIVIPPGFAASVQGGGRPDLVVLRSPDRAIGGQVAQSVAETVAARFALVATAADLAAARTGGTPPPAVVDAARSSDPAVVLADVGVGGHDLTPSAYYGASMSILFLFFTVGFAARSVMVERREGTLPRMLAGPTSPGAVLTGKVLSVAVLALAGFVTVWGVTTVVFDADWGPPAAVLALIAATVFAIAGVATMVTSLAHTPQQAETYTAVVTFALALVGGNFLGPGQLPGFIRRASLLTPNGWALRGFTDLASGSADLTGVLPTIGVLLAIGVAFGAVGVVRVRRLMDS